MKTLSTILRASLFAISAAALTCAAAALPDAPSMPVIAPDAPNGHIVFYRPSRIFGVAMTADILLDGEKVGKSISGRRFSVDTAPGVHHITVPNSVYSGTRTLDLTLKSDETVYVRTSLGGSAWGGRTNVELIDASQGEAESAGLKKARP